MNIFRREAHHPAPQEPGRNATHPADIVETAATAYAAGLEWRVRITAMLTADDPALVTVGEAALVFTEAEDTRRARDLWDAVQTAAAGEDPHPIHNLMIEDAAELAGRWHELSAPIDAALRRVDNTLSDWSAPEATRTVLTEARLTAMRREDPDASNETTWIINTRRLDMTADPQSPRSDVIAQQREISKVFDDVLDDSITSLKLGIEGNSPIEQFARATLATQLIEEGTRRENAYRTLRSEIARDADEFTIWPARPEPAPGIALRTIAEHSGDIESIIRNVDMRYMDLPETPWEHEAVKVCPLRMIMPSDAFMGFHAQRQHEIGTTHGIHR